MKIKCIVVDDEFLARTLLEDYIGKIPQLELTAKCSGAPEAMEVLQNEAVDLMFLDVQMPDLTGIDFMKTLKNKPVVIFTTAYPDYALDGYSLGVIDYLLKPISFERFFQSVNKAIEQINLLKRKESDESAGFIMIKSEHRIHKVNFENLTLHYENLFQTVIGLISNALKRAYLFEASLHDKRYVGNTRILTPYTFDKILKEIQNNKDELGMSYSLLRVSEDGKSLEQISNKIINNIRDNDYIGLSKKNKIYILLSNTSSDYANIVIDRLKKNGIKSFLLKEDIDYD